MLISAVHVDNCFISAHGTIILLGFIQFVLHFDFSVSGHSIVASRRSHVYSASKYAVTALTEGLRQELREIKSHIRITVS